MVLAHAQEGDLVVSASPRFLVEIPYKKLGLNLIASEVDIRSGKLESPNCYGEEKVRRIIEAGFPLQFEKGFSDSMSDAPMLAFAEESCLVQGAKLVPIESK